MTYYGRWTDKYEIAAQKGAAGAIIIHETGPAGYPFAVIQNSNLGEKFDLVTPNKNMDRVAIEAWVTVDRGRDILKMAGQNFDELKKLAATRDFKPVPLGVTASIELHNTLRTIDSHNFIAKVEGSDPKLKDECVVYTAHWDHLGIGPAVNGDTIYNGAIDNASGVAGLLEIASAFTKLSPPPKRSILFLSVTAEEQGLLGSQYYTANPIVPLAKTLANINMDGLNVHGRTRDITLIGYGASDLDDYARDAAAEQGRTIWATGRRAGKRVTTTAPIISTSPSWVCRRSIRTRAWISSASPPVTASRSATITRSTTITSRRTRCGQTGTWPARARI